MAQDYRHSSSVYDPSLAAAQAAQTQMQISDRVSHIRLRCLELASAISGPPDAVVDRAMVYEGFLLHD